MLLPLPGHGMEKRVSSVSLFLPFVIVVVVRRCCCVFINGYVVMCIYSMFTYACMCVCESREGCFGNARCYFTFFSHYVPRVTRYQRRR